MKYNTIIIELLAVKLAIQAFTKYRNVKAIHLEVDIVVRRTYLMKMRSNTQGKSPKADIKKPLSLDNTSLVTKDFEHANQESYSPALKKKLSEKSQRGNWFTSSEQDSTTGGFKLQEEGISKAASDLMSKSTRPNSNANYESPRRKWTSWCYRRRETDLFSNNLNEILGCFTDLYKQELQYRTLNNHRPTSTFHEQAQGKHIGEHPKVCALLAGIFNSRPHNRNTVLFAMPKKWYILSERNEEEIKSSLISSSLPDYPNGCYISFLCIRFATPNQNVHGQDP